MDESLRIVIEGKSININGYEYYINYYNFFSNFHVIEFSCRLVVGNRFFY